MFKARLPLFLVLAILASCSHKASEKEVVWDTDKPDSYYVADACEHDTHDHTEEVDNILSSNWPTPSRDIATVTGLRDIDDSESCPDVTDGEIKDIVDMIDEFGGRSVNPSRYDQSIKGFQEFLTDTGVSRNFPAQRMVTPNNPGAAQKCKLGSSLLPPKCRWMSGAVQGMLADKLRSHINDSIHLRNWWRPSCYNKAVAGASSSDHIQARGFDLDFKTPEQRAKAQKYLCDMYKKSPFNLQVGIGCNTLHVGIGSPKRLGNFPSNGSRYWTYGSLKSCKLKRVSGDDCWVMGGNKKYIHQGNAKGKFVGAL